MKTKFIIGLITLTFAYGCTAKKQTLQSIEVTQKPVPKEDFPNEKLVITAEVLAEGKSLYGMNCAKCHELYDTKSFTAEEWTPIVLRMQKKARISDEHREKIYAYLTTPQM
jgi:cytochrome c5